MFFTEIIVIRYNINIEIFIDYFLLTLFQLALSFEPHPNAIATWKFFEADSPHRSRPLKVVV